MFHFIDLSLQDWIYSDIFDVIPSFLIAYSCLFIIVLFSITLINAIAIFMAFAIEFLCGLVRNWRPSDYDIAMPTIP